MQPVKSNKTHNSKQEVIALLNKNLAAAIDLKLQVKQAHWNIKGSDFIALHELLDKAAAELELAYDEIAERAVQLGGTAFGTVQDVAKSTSLKAYPSTLSGQEKIIATIVAGYTALTDSTREAISEADDLDDAVTADLFTAVTRQLDKTKWLIESNIK